MQLALELSGAAPALRCVDAAALLEPLLRRFERGKALQEAPAFPGPWKVPGMADMCLGDGCWGYGGCNWMVGYLQIIHFSRNSLINTLFLRDIPHLYPFIKTLKWRF